MTLHRDRDAGTAPVALITGVLGQDGAYLSQLLGERGFEVHGLRLPPTAERAAAASGPEHRPHGAILHELDITDFAGVHELFAELQPDYVYNLASVSSVARSWTEPELTMQINAVGAMNLLDAAWQMQEKHDIPVRFAQASSAEIFGEPQTSPQTESCPVRPLNPYGVAKASAHHAVHAYRYRGLHASSLIFYNHESPLRGNQFVTRKITSTVAAIAKGEATELRLGNLDARRDWGWAPDFVRAMHLAASHEVSDDYVIATGVAHSVREFAAAAFAAAGIDDWERYVVVDPVFFRPLDATELCGDPSHAREQLGWQPSVSFEDMVAALVKVDLDA